MRADDRFPTRDLRPDPEAKAPAPGAEAEAKAEPEPVYCTLGDTICRVRIWTEEQWEQLPPERRPAPAEHIPGLGWVAPVPDRGPF